MERASLGPVQAELAERGVVACGRGDRLGIFMRTLMAPGASSSRFVASLIGSNRGYMGTSCCMDDLKWTTWRTMGGRRHQGPHAFPTSPANHTHHACRASYFFLFSPSRLPSYPFLATTSSPMSPTVPISEAIKPRKPYLLMTSTPCLSGQGSRDRRAPYLDPPRPTQQTPSSVPRTC